LKILNETVLLQESYFGKDNTLLECEECIKAMKEAIVAGKNPNSISEKITFESLIAKKFNCEKVYLSILADESGLNAYTVPFFYEKNHSYKDEFFELVSDNGGIHFKSATGKTLYVYINTYTIRNYSIENIMAILLHEVGHNFFFLKEQVQNRRSKLFTEFVLYILRILDQHNYHPQLVSEAVKVLINEGLAYKKGIQASSYEATKKMLSDKAFDIVNGKYKTSHTGIGKAFYTLTTIIGKTISSVFKFVNSIIYTLFFPVLINSASYKGLERSSKKTQNYAAEKFCDNFAASYGYAKGIVDTFNKTGNFSYSSKVTSKIPIVRILDYYSNSLFYFIAYMNDPHPTHQKRVTFALEKLKYELEQNRKNMSPKQIEEIEKDITDIEKLLKKTPLFKRAIDALFSGVDKKRDNAGSGDISNQDLYDFDKTILKDKVAEVKKEDLGIAAYMTEDYESAINEYFESPVMEVLNETYNPEEQWINRFLI